eukprot:CAMPEP_0194046802 /NCGR_PEP_ID=MMETSP0009_2-20130614/22317_1 /TAXON_ID=210454 /ORGANISM="Grammatophora oceanica, Strain CCMP 410" /LENGTH=486 /DNA_ID=CAMNT_0038692225 /DNA_START=55 /DNA_END=1515 /DNA_ORIENTATION=-
MSMVYSPSSITIGPMIGMNNENNMLGDQDFGNELSTKAPSSVMHRHRLAESDSHLFWSRDMSGGFLADDNHDTTTTSPSKGKCDDDDIEGRRGGPGPSILITTKAKSTGTMSPKGSKRVRFSMTQQHYASAIDLISTSLEQQSGGIPADPEQSMSLSNILGLSGMLDDVESETLSGGGAIFSLEDCLETSKELDLEETAKVHHVFAKEKWYPSDSATCSVVTPENEEDDDDEDDDYDQVNSLLSPMPLPLTPPLSGRRKPYRRSNGSIELERMISDDDLPDVWDDIEPSLEFSPEGTLTQTEPVVSASPTTTNNHDHDNNHNTSSSSIDSAKKRRDFTSSSFMNMSMSMNDISTSSGPPPTRIMSYPQRQQQAKLLMMEAQKALTTTKWNDALPFLNHALRIQRDIYGDEHLETARTLHGIGVALFQVARADDEAEQHIFDTAQTSLEEALRIRTSMSGAQHEETLETQHVLDELEAAADICRRTF